MVEGLAPKERRLPPPGCLGGGGCGAWEGSEKDDAEREREREQALSNAACGGDKSARLSKWACWGRLQIQMGLGM